MSHNIDRYAEIQLYDDQHDGIALSDLSIEFTITKVPGSRFNSATATIVLYNLSEETRQRITQKKLTRLRVIAGYRGWQDSDGTYPDKNYGVIFDGDIRTAGAKAVGNNQNNNTVAVDHLLEITCVASWSAHLFAFVKKTLQAGWCYRDLFDTSMVAYQAYGVMSGNAPVLPPMVFPRAKVLFSPASEVLYQLAEKNQSHWWYDNGQVYMVPDEGYLNRTVVLNADTGLIGAPQRNSEGNITLRCLINPEICLRGQIRLDQKALYSESGFVAATDRKLALLDGDYIVDKITYQGKTRGQEWYMTLECRSLSQAKPVEAAPSTH